MAKRARQPYQGVEADSDTPYVAEFEYDLSSFETVIAGPHDITLIRGLSEVLGLEIQAANIGSCSSGVRDCFRATGRRHQNGLALRWDRRIRA